MGGGVCAFGGWGVCVWVVGFVSGSGVEGGGLSGGAAGASGAGGVRSVFSLAGEAGARGAGGAGGVGAEGELAGVIGRASAGDEGAWREIVGRYGRRLFALARSRLGSDEAAEELVQSVFVTLAEKLPAAEAGYREVGRFESWLFRIAMNRVRDEGRRRGRRADHFGEDALSRVAGGDGADGDGGDGEARVSALSVLRRAVAGLGDAEREVVELRHFGGMSFKGISELLGCPMGTALARHHRALKKLRAAMEAEGGVDVDGLFGGGG